MQINVPKSHRTPCSDDSDTRIGLIEPLSREKGWENDNINQTSYGRFRQNLETLTMANSLESESEEPFQSA